MNRNCNPYRKSRLAGLLGAVIGSVIIPSAPSAGAAEHYSGDAQSKDGTLLYREQHWLYQDQGTQARLVLYTCADGRPFARKKVWNRPNAQAPDFELDDARDGFSEGVRTEDGARRVFVRVGKQAAAREASITDAGDTVIDAGFDAFVREHWEALLKDKAMPLSFVVPSKLAAMDFKVVKVGDETIAGRSAHRFRLSLARWYGGILPHIDVIYDAQTRELVRYEGISNIRGANDRNLEVDILFKPGQSPENVSDADVAAAAGTALNGTCKL